MSVPSSTETKILERLEDKIKWYDKKSVCYKTRSIGLRITQATLTIVISLVSAAYESELFNPIVIWVCSGLFIFLESLSQICKYHELWISYRTTCEKLINQKYRFLANVNPYDSDDPKERISALTLNLEKILTSEVDTWSNSIHKPRQGSKEKLISWSIATDV
ncbi:MAG: DUF4231 domain-containing protein [Alphaproteobacteria bacterium]|nr:DUF4231 domain-containing protein [Alphaproteobacteria bacterium]